MAKKDHDESKLCSRYSLTMKIKLGHNIGHRHHKNLIRSNITFWIERKFRKFWCKL